MKYVSIDIETTGLDPFQSQILEIGAVIDLSSDVSTDKLPTFHCYIVHDIIFGQAYALSMHPTILRRIATQEDGYTYLRAEEVAPAFDRFLAENYYEKKADGAIDKRVNAAGKNFAGFDLQFLKQLPEWDDFIQIRHRVIDPAMLYWEPGDTRLPDTKECKKRAGLDGDVAHTALEDAFDVVALIRMKRG